MGYYSEVYKHRLEVEAAYSNKPIDSIVIDGIRITEPQAIYYAPFALRLLCFARFGNYALTFTLDNSYRIIPAILVDERHGSQLYGLRDDQWTYMHDARFAQESVDASLRRLEVLIERMKTMGQIIGDYWRPYLHDAIAIADFDSADSHSCIYALSLLGFEPTVAASVRETGITRTRVWQRELDHALRALELERVE